jgi:hypothetical protein
MRVLLLLLFLVLAVAAIGVVAYRYNVNQMRMKRRRLADLKRRPTPEERYQAGEIDLNELNRLLDLELQRRDKRS